MYDMYVVYGTEDARRVQAANYEEGTAGTAEDDANDDDALMQFELLEVLVRLAFARYLLSRELSDASDAVERLLAEHVIPSLPPEALVDTNEFRFERMYNRAVEGLLIEHKDFLAAVYAVRPFLKVERWL